MTFTRESPHLEEGYPGTVQVKTTYILTHDNALRIVMEVTVNTHFSPARPQSHPKTGSLW